MNGTENQIKWANEIKENFKKNIAEMTWEDFLTHIDGDQEDYKEEDFRKVVNVIMSCNNAATWIDNFANVDFSRDNEKSAFTDNIEYMDDEDYSEISKKWGC